MGFWDVTKRLLQGRPAFEVGQATDDWDDEPTVDFAEERQEKRAEAENQTLYDDHGHKHIPIASVTNVKSTQHGDHIELWATVTNQSDRELKLDKITLLGTKFIMDYPLHAGAQRVFRVYAGPQVMHDSYKKAELYYQDTATNDYFRADHLVDFRYENDGSYDINGFNLIMPIRDL